MKLDFRCNYKKCNDVTSQTDCALFICAKGIENMSGESDQARFFGSLLECWQ